MINIYDFVQRNDKENFKKCCSEVSSILENHTNKLVELRETLYNCIKQQCKKLEDSQLQEDTLLLEDLIKICKSSHKKSVFLYTICTFEQYKEEFNKIDKVIQKNLRKMSTTQMRSFSTNMKMYDNVMNKRNMLYNFYNSFDDLDSPVKIKADVFTF
ncbi:hypothetical protein ABPG72_003600 [Tetrahymena utriculariae]